MCDSDWRPNVRVYEESRANDYCSVLWEITKDEYGEVVVNELWREYDQNSAKAETMAAVFNDAFERYPSKEKGVILWYARS